MPVYHVAPIAHHAEIEAEGVTPWGVHGRLRNFPNLSSKSHVYFWETPELAAWWSEVFCYKSEIWECEEPPVHEDDPNLAKALRTHLPLAPIRTLGASEIPEAVSPW